MNQHILWTALGLGLLLNSFHLQANDKVERVYDAQRYQNVCKGKNTGDWVSFAHRGIIWNGSCQPQFFSSSKMTQLRGDEAQLHSACRENPKVSSINIEGRTYTGKCALGFTPPVPKPENR